MTDWLNPEDVEREINTCLSGWRKTKGHDRKAEAGKMAAAWKLEDIEHEVLMALAAISAEWPERGQAIWMDDPTDFGKLYNVYEIARLLRDAWKEIET